MSKYSFKNNFTVAPWPHKDKKLVSLTISTDPSYIWSTDSKTELRLIREWGKTNPGFHWLKILFLLRYSQ